MRTPRPTACSRDDAQTGIAGDYKGSQAREAMLTLDEWEAMKAHQQADAESGITV